MYPAEMIPDRQVLVKVSLYSPLYGKEKKGQFLNYYTQFIKYIKLYKIKQNILNQISLILFMKSYNYFYYGNKFMNNFYFEYN